MRRRVTRRLIWIQTVCKGNNKVASRVLKVNALHPCSIKQPPVKETARLASLLVVFTLLYTAYLVFVRTDITIIKNIGHKHMRKLNNDHTKGDTDHHPKTNAGVTHAAKQISDETEDVVSETRHIAFLKVHKAGSSTIQNILYRFGLARNLTFVLSNNSNYLSRRKRKLENIMPLPKYHVSSGRFDIVCNHAVFDLDVFEKWMYPDAKYFAIVREPLDLLISAARYYRFKWPVPYIRAIRSKNFIKYLIRNPKQFEPRDVATSRTFNYMSRDFGFVLNSTDDVLTVTEKQYDHFLEQISDTFKLVLIMEKFDESLVLLKRRYRWSIKDILYIKNNANKARGKLFSRESLSSSDIAAFRRMYWMDIKLYDYFFKRFERQVKTETNFSSEVKCFQKYLEEMQNFCTATTLLNSIRHIELQASECSASFIVTTEECSLMLLEELVFYKKLVHRHEAMLE